MKIAIIGVGAIGGYLGTRLALAGEDVTFIARGASLEALRARGIRLLNADGSEEAVPRVKATDNYADAGVQDIVVLAMKAHQVEAVTGRCQSCLALGPSSSRCKTAYLIGIFMARAVRLQEHGSPAPTRAA